MALTIYANCSSSDLPLDSSGIDWVEIDESSDELIFTAGSTEIADGEVITGSDALNQAGVVLIEPRVEQTIDKYLLADNSAGIYKEIELAGSGNFQHVFCCSWNSSTASEPTAELYDSSDLDTIDNVSLGSGVASSSWWRGITTTDSLPGVAWTGSRLAGSADGHFLFLNDQNGALTVATNLYFQLKIVIPSTQLTSGAEVPVLVIKYADTP